VANRNNKDLLISKYSSHGLLNNGNIMLRLSWLPNCQNAADCNPAM
jgi:hypothetical protein